MNLDDPAIFQRLDPQNMLAHINGLPQQLEDAWNLGMALALPVRPRPRSVLLCGMGGSAIGADLLAAYAAPLCPVPLIVHRDYDLPAFASGPDTLVIACSHSGDSEETLSAYQQARELGCATLVITTGGKLAQLSQASAEPTWLFDYPSQPRAAVGFSFGLLFAALYRLGLLPDPSADFQEMLSALRTQQSALLADVPTTRNPAKRQAGQMMGRIVLMFGADDLAPVARRWKDQLNENAKACAQFEFLPEADHNTLAGINHPESALSQVMAIFLQAKNNHPRNQIRLDFTRQIFMTQGINTDSFQAKGESRLAQIWTVLHLGDYITYYLALAYGEDPTPVDALVMMKEALATV